MPNASDFGFAIDDQLLGRDPSLVTEAVAKAASLLVADHYEIEVIG